MKKMFAVMSSLALMAVLALGALAQTPAANRTAPAKTKHTVAPKSDADIQKCIEDKLAGSAALKGDGFKVAVSNGVATFTGTTKVKGHKGGVARLAKSCGAKSVTNNITVEAAAKTNASTSTTGGTAATGKKTTTPKKP